MPKPCTWTHRVSEFDAAVARAVRAGSKVVRVSVLGLHEELDRCGVDVFETMVAWTTSGAKLTVRGYTVEII